MSTEQDIEVSLKEAQTIAVVGLSPEPERPSYGVACYLRSQGYRVIPVNPAVTEILGMRCYPNLTSVLEPVDIVNVFRRPEEVPAIVEEAVRIGAKMVWMQEGIVHQRAAARARQAGLKVVMNRCLRVEHERLLQKGTLSCREKAGR